MIDIVFFDAGETILRPHPSFADLFVTVCREQGCEVAPDDVRAVQERLAPHLTDISEETGVERPSLSPEASRQFWTYLYRRFLEELSLDPSLAPALYARFSHPASYKLFDDVLPTFDRLASVGLRLGLISNFEQWLEEMLVELEVGHLFDVAVISGIHGVEKPDRRIYEIALKEADVAPAAALHVGDSITMDVEPASAVGMRTVLLDRAGRYWDRATEWVRISSLEELPPLLSNL